MQKLNEGEVLLDCILAALDGISWLLKCASKEVKGRTLHHKDYFYSLPSISGKIMNSHNTKYPQTI